MFESRKAREKLLDAINNDDLGLIREAVELVEPGNGLFGMVLSWISAFVRFITGNSFDVNQTSDANHYHQTALHVAALEGDADLVKRLLRLGADPRIKDKNNHTPIFKICWCSNSEEAIEVLNILKEPGMEEGLESPVVDDNLFLCAIKMGNIGVVKHLHNEYKLEINMRDADGNNMLDLACMLERDNSEVIKYIMHNRSFRDGAGDNIVVVRRKIEESGYKTEFSHSDPDSKVFIYEVIRNGQQDVGHHKKGHLLQRRQFDAGSRSSKHSSASSVASDSLGSVDEPVVRLRPITLSPR